MNYRKLVIILLSISVFGFFLPWFYFSKSVDYSTGWNFVLNSPIIIVGLFASSILISIPNHTKGQYISTLIFLSIIPITCIYLFFTWHVLTITGKIELETSLSTTHYGFYITLISSSLATIVYSIKGLKESR
ncbi:MAG: hypothetical protein RR645_07695 [Clostridium sp.]